MRPILRGWPIRRRRSGGGSPGWCSFRVRSSRPAILVSDTLHLLEMIQVVAGEQAHQVGDGFFAALLVHAVIFPQILGDRLQQGEVTLPQHAEQFERSFGVATAVVERPRPDILIECLNGSGILTQDGTEAPGGHHFDVGKVGEDLGDRPFLRRRALAQEFVVETFHHGGQLAGGRALYTPWVFALHVTEDAFDVLVRSFPHDASRTEPTAKRRDCVAQLPFNFSRWRKPSLAAKSSALSVPL